MRYRSYVLCCIVYIYISINRYLILYLFFNFKKLNYYEFYKFRFLRFCFWGVEIVRESVFYRYLILNLGLIFMFLKSVGLIFVNVSKLNMCLNYEFWMWVKLGICDSEFVHNLGSEFGGKTSRLGYLLRSGNPSRFGARGVPLKRLVVIPGIFCRIWGPPILGYFWCFSLFESCQRFWVINFEFL